MKTTRNRKHLVLSIAVAAATVAMAERQPLWPEGAMPDRQPHQIAAMTDEADAEGFDRAAHVEPFLEWYAPPAPETTNGVCAVLISGGSYEMCCDVGLIRDWRERLTKLGCQCVNLVYRTPRPKGLPIHQSAWEDGQRAIRLVRSQATARGFDPEKIGVFSMSAGSHLATLLATSSQTNAYEAVDELDAVPCHLNWACTFAIAYGMTDGIGVPNSKGGDADAWAAMNSVKAWEQLRRIGVQGEVHTLATRQHCFQSSASPGTGSYTYLDRIWEFLSAKNLLK